MGIMVSFVMNRHMAHFVQYNKIKFIHVIHTLYTSVLLYGVAAFDTGWDGHHQLQFAAVA